MENKIIEKIQKLLALSESSNENEAQAALIKAQELLIRHKLSIKEVNEFKADNVEIKNKRSKITFTKAKWKAVLGVLIADNFGCYCYCLTRGNHTIVFLGKTEEVFICNIVLEYAVDCINSAVNKIKYKYKKHGISTAGIENDYALGFIKGLKEKFEEQKRKNEEWGLVLTKAAEVIEAHNKIEFKTKVNATTNFEGHSEAYEKGQEEGSKFSVSDRIAEGDEVLSIMNK